MWEVVDPSSRAVELGAEDEEEEKCVCQSKSSKPVLRLSNEVQDCDKKVSCQLLVLAFERIPTSFIQAHFMNSDTRIVGVVSSGKERCHVNNSLLQTASSDKTCFIHSTTGPNKVLFCQCKVDILPEACHNWANEVLSKIKPEKVLILSSLPASVCSLNIDVNGDQIFALKTDSWESNICCQFLPLPNIVSNLPAAALSYCQIFKIPALAYIAVTTTDSVADSTAIEIFNTLLKHEPLKDLPKCSKLETAEFLKSLKITPPHLQSNIYI
ncbi:proteasome assembly chaperone 1-like [Dendronephthya gigantea]|uniref:proteasome assembly chaperone 1-like n=1 Tax=Dendronephthya gigantea TaxID=151771 RepID=UPI00106A9CA6|nr:proteasome assembly chaperone 1-like [Dendronephthya gigantea]